MFVIKKIFNSSKSRKSSNNLNSCLESDALPVDQEAIQTLERTTQQLQQTNYNNNSIDFVNPSADPGNDVMNVNNVNQQMVVQFSNINGLQIGSTYNINKTNIVNNNDKPKDGQNKLKYPKTITIDTMMKSKDEPSREILNEIATHLGTDYRHFMRELGFSDGQISSKVIDHNIYGIKEVIYQLLLDWSRNADDEGTVGFLTTKLWNSGQRECVYRLKLLWKSKAFERTNVAVD